MRRLALALALAMTQAAICGPSAAAAAAVPGVVHQPPAVYRFTIGDARVTALSDGTMPLDLHRMLTGISPAETDALLARSFLLNPVQPSINCFLIELGGRRILVDTGAGVLFGPGNGGRLPEALTAAGVGAEQIDDILITHVHPDHIGGLVSNGRMVFPKATVHVGKPDMDLFLDARKSGNARASDQAAAMLGPYMAADKVRPFERDGEILPGVSAELRPGHSPGSAVFRLKSGGQELVVIGDIVHVGAVQLERPEVGFVFDWKPEMAVADRKDALSDFARDGTLVAAPHMSFPGVGHFRSDGHAYRWFPIEYANRDPDLPGPGL